MTDEEFAEFCSEHPDLFFETTAEGELIVMPPPYSLTGIRQGKIYAQLNRWAELEGHGVAGEANTAFVLPSGARRSPDAAWIRKERIRRLDPKMLQRYWHLCPDFVIEVRSPTDRVRTLREKMREWMDNGAQLGWMLDPENRTVEIYRPHGEVELRSNPESVAGEGPVEGFVLNLAPVWDPLGE
jgi:Uma2 family endonuclease